MWRFVDLSSIYNWFYIGYDSSGGAFAGMKGKLMTRADRQTHTLYRVPWNR